MQSQKSEHTNHFDHIKVSYKAPSNIAFIKYWGKKFKQLPMNPSLSMTLEKCHTITDISFHKNNSSKLNLKSFLLDGLQNNNFSKRIEDFIESNIEHFNFLVGYDLNITTTNSFPHSSGIASSASGMAAFVLCLLEFESILLNSEIDFKKASELSRLASGSASRSIYGGFSTWGKSTIPFSSDEYALKLNDLGSFPKLYDAIIIVSKTEKSVSSSAGHNLMNAHPFAESRYMQAKDNLADMIRAMKDGDFEVFGELLELEALTLHALMLSSSPSFILLEPKSLEVISLLKEFRLKTETPVYFTIDAGPNIHLIYPEAYKEIVKAFIEDKIANISENVIFDHIGNGPILLEKKIE